MKTYVLTSEGYSDAIRLLRYLRKKNARLHKVIVIVSIDDHRKIKNFILRGQQALIVIVR